jgi:Protein of unknown function (DUF692)
VQRTGCGLILDVNNVYVSAVNHGRDPRAWPQEGLDFGRGCRLLLGRSGSDQLILLDLCPGEAALFDGLAAGSPSGSVTMQWALVQYDFWLIV